MSDVVIQVNGLGKRYRIGAPLMPRTRGEALWRMASAPFGWLARNLRGPTEEETLWALRNVSFDVSRGEVLGIIGRNGAGKSTLLKILSRITDPTEGRAEVHGRIGSLLEVGTGFHPELTGRENIYLNGAILGMRRREIARKFDQIVSFAEVEKFMDTAVKHYSSGMYVRLAFSVAAHLETEILVVDEVLSVGDIAFQRKCLDTMGDLVKGGRTVLFVSHSMGAIRGLCNRGLWVEQGGIRQAGPAEDVVAAYERSALERGVAGASVERPRQDRTGRQFYLARVSLRNGRDETTTVFRYGETLVLLVDIAGHPETRAYHLEFRIRSEVDQLVGFGSTALHGILMTRPERAARRMRIEIGPLALTSGRYEVSLSAVDSQANLYHDSWPRCCSFEIVDCKPFGFGHELSTRRDGACALPQRFRELQADCGKAP